MNQSHPPVQNDSQDTSGDSRADAFAAVILVLCVASFAIFWVSSH